MSNTSKKLRVLVDSTSARAGAKEVTSAMGKVVTSGKTTISTFKELNTVLGQTGTQFSKLKQMQKSYNPFATLEKSIESYTKQMTKAMTQGQTFTVKLKEGNAQVTQSLKDTEAQTKKTANQFIKLKDTTDVPFSKVSKEIAALSKAIEKLNNTMYAEEARTKALNTELGKNSVKVQEQRRLSEELLRSKTRLNSTYSDEYVQLVRTRKAIEDRNKEIRTMDNNITKTKKSVGNLNSSFSMLGTTLAGLSIYFSTAGLIRQADAYTNLTNKLSAVTQGTVNVTNASRDLLAMSIENRSSMEGTMDIYTKMTRINETMGKSQQDVKDITEAVSKAVAMSGASAQGAQGSIMQFGQAMASNFASSAQELNSMLEQTQAFAYYFVEGINEVDSSLNLTTATLKKFAEEGGLSTELAAEALLRILPRIREDFGTTSQAVESATQNLTDSFSVLIGELDDGYGATDSIVDAMTDLAEVLPDLKDELTAITAGVTVLISTAALGGLASIIAAIGLPIVGLVAGISALAGGFTYLYLESTKWDREAEITKERLDELTESTSRFEASLTGLSSSSLEGVYNDLSSEIETLTDKMNSYQDALTLSIETEKLFTSSDFSERKTADASNILSTSERTFNSEEVVRLSDLIDVLNARLEKTKENLDKSIYSNALSGKQGLIKTIEEIEKDTKGLSSEYKAYQKDLDNISKAYDKAYSKISKVTDAEKKANLVTELRRVELEGNAAALNKYASEITTVKDLLDKASIKDDDISKANALYNTQISKLKEVYKEQKAIYDLQLQKGVISPEEHQANIKKLDEYKTKVEGIYAEGLVKGDDFDWAKAFEGASPAFVEALTSGDFSSIGDSLGSIIGSYASNALGTGLMSSLGGGLIGAAASYGLSSIFSSYESVGTSSTVSVNGSDISGYSQEDFEKSGLFGGSKSVIDEYTSLEISAISNTVAASQRTIASLLGSMGSALIIGIEEFSTTVTADDLDTAIEDITEEFLYANVAYIESFMDTNQTAIEALADIAEAWGALESAFDTINVDALEDSIDSVVTDMASALTDSYTAQITELETSLSDANSELSSILANPEGETERGMKFYTVTQRNQIEALEDLIDSAGVSIIEATSRLSSVYEEAYTTFTSDLEDAVAAVNNVDLDSAWDLFSEQVENYAENFYSETEQFQNAMEAAAEDLLDFSDLGIDSTTSLSEFREAFEAFASSDAFTAEGYAEWMAAASALTEFTDASEGLDDVFEDITDYVSELMGLTADGTQSLASARAEYEAVLSLAQSGDSDAIDDLTTYADNYLEIAEANASTAADLALARASVIADLTNLTGTVPEFATGGNHEGGWRVVGDGGNGSGTELEYTGSSQIFNGKQASTLIDVDGLREELSEIRMILRSGMGTLAKNTNKSYKVLDRWDNVGLPQERNF